MIYKLIYVSVLLRIFTHILLNLFIRLLLINLLNLLHIIRFIPRHLMFSDTIINSVFHKFYFLYINIDI